VSSPLPWELYCIEKCIGDVPKETVTDSMKFGGIKYILNNVAPKIKICKE